MSDESNPNSADAVQKLYFKTLKDEHRQKIAIIENNPRSIYSVPVFTLFSYISDSISVANKGLPPEIEDCPNLPITDRTDEATDSEVKNPNNISSPLLPQQTIWSRLYTSERFYLITSGIYAFFNCCFFLIAFLLLHSFLLSLECAPKSTDRQLLFPVITEHCEVILTATGNKYNASNTKEINYLYNVIHQQGLFMTKNVLKLVGTPSTSFWMFLYAASIGLAAFLRNLNDGWKTHLLLSVGRRARAATNSWVFRRVLYGNNGDSSKTSKSDETNLKTSQPVDVGSVLTLISNDSQKWLDAAPTVHEFWSCPLILIVTIYFIFKLMGWPAICVVIIQGFCMLPIMLKCNAISSGYRAKRLKLVEERTRLTNELLTGIRVVKVFAWETAYVMRIEALRKEEVQLVYDELKWKFWSVNNTILTPILTQVITLAVYALIAYPAKNIDPLEASLRNKNIFSNIEINDSAAVADAVARSLETENALSPSRVFAFLYLSQQLRLPVLRLGHLVNSIFQMKIGVGRMQNFINTGNVEGSGGTDTNAGGDKTVVGIPIENKKKKKKYNQIKDNEEAKPLLLLENSDEVAYDENAKDLTPKLAMKLSPQASETKTNSSSINKDKDVLISFQNAVVGWPETEDTSAGKEKDDTTTKKGGSILGPLNLDIARGSIKVLLGEVGSGKTTFLSALTNEATVSSTDGNTNTNSQVPPLYIKNSSNLKIALVTQSAWLRNATIRENIVFFRDFDQYKYDRAVEMTQLRADFKQLEVTGDTSSEGNSGNRDNNNEVLPGDLTEIGERGITLSGGQKMRVALARALYDFDDTDLFLFDDVFSALDAETGQKVSEAILNAARERHEKIIFRKNMIKNMPSVQGGESKLQGILKKKSAIEVSATMIFSAHKRFWPKEMEESGEIGILCLKQLEGDSNGVNQMHQVIEANSSDDFFGASYGGSCLSLVDGKKNEESNGNSNEAFILVDSNGKKFNENTDAGEVGEKGDGNAANSNEITAEELENLNKNDTPSKAVEVRKRKSRTKSPKKTSPSKNSDKTAEKKTSTMTVESRGTATSAFSKEILIGIWHAIGRPYKVMFWLTTFCIAEPLTYFMFEGWMNTWMAANSIQTVPEADPFSNNSNNGNNPNNNNSGNNDKKEKPTRSSLFVFLTVFADWAQRKLFNVPDDKWNLPLDSPQLNIDPQNRQMFYMLVYMAFFTVMAVVICNNKLGFPRLGTAAAESLFSSMLKSVVRAPVAFFDTTPIGRILTRFGFDTENNDTAVIWKSQPALDLLRMMVQYVFLNSILFFPYFLFCIPILAIGVFFFRKTSKFAVREYQKLDNLSRSPIAALVTESLSGLEVIRVFKKSDVYQQRFAELTDRNQRAIYGYDSAQRWLNMRVDSIMSGLIILMFVLGVFFNLDAALMGCGIFLLLQFGNMFGATIMFFGILEAGMTSVERALEYGEIENGFTRDSSAAGIAKDGGYHSGLDSVSFLNKDQKGKWLNKTQKLMDNNSSKKKKESKKSTVEVNLTPVKTTSSSKSNNGLLLDSVFMRYRPELEYALKNISLHIPPGQRCAVVGRTGSGKSSLAAAILRTVVQVKQTNAISNSKDSNPITSSKKSTNTNGTNWNDNCLTGSIQLHGCELLDENLSIDKCRSKIGLITQDPVVFGGVTVRYNLDPFNEYTDRECQEALVASQLAVPEGEKSPSKKGSNNGKEESNAENTGGNAASSTSTRLHLDTMIEDNGRNLSLGERQLLCLARVLLRQDKVELLLCDEATASVDLETDRKVQKSIREWLKKPKVHGNAVKDESIKNPIVNNTVVLTIAHRLETVADYEYVIQLDAGNVVEFGKIDEVYAKRRFFWKLVQNAGVQELYDARILKRISTI